MLLSLFPILLLCLVFVLGPPPSHATRGAGATVGQCEAPLHGHVDTSELVQPWDVVIIGGGPSGIGAGCASRLLGKRVLIVSASDAPVGEIAPGEGSPSGLFSKALRDAAKTLDVAVLQALGLDRRVIWAQVRRNTAQLAAEGASRGTFLMRDLGVQVVRGTGRLRSPTEVTVTLSGGEEVVVTAGLVVIATGSRPREPPGVPFDGRRIFTAESIKLLDALPKTVTISGGGIIAIEFAKVFTLFGCNVTMLVRDRDPRLGLTRRAGMDLDVATELIRDLNEHGVRILTSATAAAFDVPSSMEAPVQVTLAGGATVQSDIYLAATGQVPNTAGLGLEAAGVELDSGGRLVVNERLQSTTVPTVFGAGDVLGSPALASTADIQGHAAVGHAFLSGGGPDRKDALPAEGAAVLRSMMDALRTINMVGFPVGVWTLPEVSYFGYTREAARKAGMGDAEEAVASYSTCLRGRVFSPQGFLKLVYRGRTGQIVGAHIIGEDACEMIHFGMQLVQDNRTVAHVMSEPFTAVTFHELYMWAARIAVLRSFAQELIWRKVKSHGVCSGAGAQANNGDGQAEDALAAGFSSLDLDHDDMLSGAELAVALSNSGGVFGIVWNGMQLTSLLVQPHDDDGSGALSLEEFRVLAGHWAEDER